MKTLKNFLGLAKISLSIYLMLSMVFWGSMSCSVSGSEKATIEQNQPVPVTPPDGTKKIKIALLLDTSNSMDGLIDQAKSQLWKLVNELSRAQCDNTKANLEIALYEYGNDNLPSSEGFIRQVTPLTNDLDKISEDLFALTTYGGDEYCGQVINKALTQLEWTKAKGDLQMIFIAGNEPFTQGTFNYKDVCLNAKEKDIVVNTIFCGSFDEGIRTDWKKGSELTHGSYMSIEQDRKTVFVESPYDKDITSLNEDLNKTYLPYGVEGKNKKQNQEVQDNNASTYGSANTVQRIVTKSSHVYRNESWDLVDYSKQKDFDIDKLSTKDLPEEMQKMSTAEREKYISDNLKKRESLQAKIKELNKSRLEFVSSKEKETGDEASLDNAMLSAVRNQAKLKNFEFVD